MKHVKKDWGREAWVTNNELYCVKFLYLDPGWASSLHRHIVKDETFYVMAGFCQLDLNDGVHNLAVGSTVRIHAGTWHRFSNPTNDLCVILEASTHHEDADVERKIPSGPLSSVQIPPDSSPEPKPTGKFLV